MLNRREYAAKDSREKIERSEKLAITLICTLSLKNL